MEFLVKMIRGSRKTAALTSQCCSQPSAAGLADARRKLKRYSLNSVITKITIIL